MHIGFNDVGSISVAMLAVVAVVEQGPPSLRGVQPISTVAAPLFVIE